MGYLDFLSLLSASRVAITDSGGIQEETTFLRIPCLTLRSNTERPLTIAQGTNTLVGDDLRLLERLFGQVLAGTYKRGRRPRLWDGRAAERIAGIVAGSG
jgi:UDP-N-acetylglucosamine 2-epimerase (non-hydrolysing)